MHSLLVLFMFLGMTTAQHSPNVVEGRSAMVHLFEWRWEDIALECERFLGPYGYAGVQTSPPTENAAISQGNVRRPWWERYQPVSYKLQTRSGNEDEFQDMVRRCNNVGVRIYADMVINHMTGWQPSGTPTTGDSDFDAGSLQYPGVPYGPNDFNGPAECPSGSGNIEDYQDPIQVRNCKLSGLNDLKQSTDYVRGKTVELLNRLVSYGVAGFRLDASKHMWPGDMKTMLDQLNDLPTDAGFPAGSRPFIFSEVIDLGGEPITSDEYVSMGRVTEFKNCKYLAETFRKRDNAIKWLSNYGEGWGMIAGGNAVVFIDNHDNQRGHGAGGEYILTFRASRLYKMAYAFQLAYPYGFPRVMSSYNWDQDWENGQDKNDWVGPPMDANENILPIEINDDMTCGGGRICEHRWRQIYNMVQFRNVAGSSELVAWTSGTDHQIAFAREGRGWILINNDDFFGFAGEFETTLPAGDYCDVISGIIEDGQCTGKVITVNDSGKAYVEVLSDESDPMVAIHLESKL